MRKSIKIEHYIGHQQNTIDAQENPYEVIVSNKLYEQQDYVVETNHLPHLISLVVSKEFYDQLTEEDQQILAEAQEIAKKYSRQASDERISQKIQTIQDSGTEILTLDEQTRQEMIEASAPIYEEIRQVANPEMYRAYKGVRPPHTVSPAAGSLPASLQ